MPAVCWLIFSFQLALGAVFYPIKYVPFDTVPGFDTRRNCPTLTDCDADYLCNIWSEDDTEGNGPSCFYGKPDTLESYEAKEVWLKVRSKTQCEGGNTYLNRSHILKEVLDGFECYSKIKGLQVSWSPEEENVIKFHYTELEIRKTFFTFDVTVDTSEAPYTEENYAKVYSIALTAQNVSTCGYAIGSGTISGPTVSCNVGEPMQLYCRNEKLYFDVEMKTGQLVQYLLDGKSYLPL